ncbi:MAG: aldehyde dehydrogenase family protein, partial [Chloroflexota bacterium]|nr:aldehyde dehydrogenase family protein [Chloroflexota bacterium]
MIQTSSRVLAAADPQAALYNFIGGEWVAASATEKIVVENPATGIPIAAVPDSNRDDVDTCVAAALDAFSSWRKIPPVESPPHHIRLKHKREEEIQ